VVVREETWKSDTCTARSAQQYKMFSIVAKPRAASDKGQLSLVRRSEGFEPAAQPQRMVPYGLWGCLCQQSSARSSRTTREIIRYLKHSSQKDAIKNAFSEATANIFHPFLSFCKHRHSKESEHITSAAYATLHLPANA